MKTYFVTFSTLQLNITSSDYTSSITAHVKSHKVFFSCGSTDQIWALAASMKLSVSFQLLDLGQSAGILGWVISSSQGLCYLPRVNVMMMMMEKLVE
jgi:hypothetical protein